MVRSIGTTLLAAAARFDPGGGPLRWDIGPSGDFYAWAAEPSPEGPIRVYHGGKSAIETFELPHRPLGYDFIQPLDEGLLVAGRNGDDGATEGLILDERGAVLGTLNLATGVADLKTTHSGRIWVSYFDEGVFSNDDLSSEGLACFDRAGRVLLGFNTLAEQNSLPLIEDCYAINAASDDEIWAYYFSSFPLVKLGNLRIERVISGLPLQGARAVAVDGRRALFWRSYDGRHPLTLVDLETLDYEPLVPITADGGDIDPGGAYGRGPILYLAEERALFSVDLRELE